MRISVLCVVHTKSVKFVSRSLSQASCVAIFQRCQLIFAFTERLYQIEHPRLVAQFDEVCDVQQGESGYWISKAWLKGTPTHLVTIRLCHSWLHSPARVTCIGWRVQKPKMHVPLHGDPPPDSAEFRGHVRCEHDQLSLVSTARRSISSQVSSGVAQNRNRPRGVDKRLFLIRHVRPSRSCSLNGYHYRPMKSPAQFARLTFIARKRISASYAKKQKMKR